jgi:hypothetical protein
MRRFQVRIRSLLIAIGALALFLGLIAQIDNIIQEMILVYVLIIFVISPGWLPVVLASLRPSTARRIAVGAGLLSTPMLVVCATLWVWGRGPFWGFLCFEILLLILSLFISFRMSMVWPR